MKESSSDAGSRQRILLLLVFTLTLAAGTLLFDDYGIGWDEPIQRELGLRTWDYIRSGDDSLFRLINRYHGPFVELVECVPEVFFGVQDERTVYLSRHAINYLIFWFGAVFFYLLAKDLLKSKGYALAAVIMLFLSPRMVAHSFFNSKDLPLLSFFIIGFYVWNRFLQKPGYLRAVALALVTGMVVSIRVLGLLIPATVLLQFLMDRFRPNTGPAAWKPLLLYFLLLPLGILLFYPVLWNDPIGELAQAIRIMSHYPYDDPQLFMGRLYPPADLPWYYIPVWMAITIPLWWSVLFFAGFVSGWIRLAKGKDQQFLVLVMVWLCLPWIAVLVLRSVVYDEWRHLFFTYPAFLLLAAYGWKQVSGMFRKFSYRPVSIALQSILPVLFTFQCLMLLVFISHSHPYQQVYFNELAGKNQEQKFDLDYWGLSYREGLERLVRSQPESRLKVCWQNAPGNFNLLWLDALDNARILEVPFDSCSFFITNYRFHPDDYDAGKMKELLSVTVLQNRILTVFVKDSLHLETLVETGK